MAKIAMKLNIDKRAPARYIEVRTVSWRTQWAPARELSRANRNNSKLLPNRNPHRAAKIMLKISATSLLRMMRTTMAPAANGSR